MSPKTRGRAQSVKTTGQAPIPSIALAAVSPGYVSGPAAGGPSRIDDVWEQMLELCEGDDELLALLDQAQGLASTRTLSDNTVTLYTRRWNDFFNFTSRYGLEALPADPATVLLYLATFHSNPPSDSLISQVISAINHHHVGAGWNSPTENGLVRNAALGLRRMRASRGRPTRQAHPISAGDLLVMVEALDDLSFRRIEYAELGRLRIKAVVLMAWHLGRRLDEIARADLSWIMSTSSGVTFSSSSQKCRPNGFENHMWPTSDPRICPVTALDEWLVASEPYRNGVTRLFPGLSLDENRQLVLVDLIEKGYERSKARGRDDFGARFETDAEFEAFNRNAGVQTAITELRYRMKLWMAHAGLEPDRADRVLSGHSTRRGLVTELNKAGVSFTAIADHVGFHGLDLIARYSDHTPDEHPLTALRL